MINLFLTFLYHGGNNMNKKVLALVCSLLFILISITGCSSSVKEENLKLTKEISTLKEKNTELEKKVGELTEESKTLKDKLNGEGVQGTDELSSNLYTIYTADENTGKKVKDVMIYISKDSTLNQKLGILGKTLSEVYFSNLPIEVSSIKTIDGKKIAEINLRESKENQGISDPSKFKGKSWATNYFQGSSGGAVTATSLVETFLQRDYKGQWVDGVKFLYNGKTIEYDHVPELGEINYRKQSN